MLKNLFILFYSSTLLGGQEYPVKTISAIQKHTSKEIKESNNTLNDLDTDSDEEFNWNQYEFVEDWKKDDIDSVMKLLRNFTFEELKRNNWKESMEQFELTLKEITIKFPSGSDISNTPHAIMDEITNIYISFYSKYQDDLLKYNGLFLNGTYPGGYSIFFDTASKNCNIGSPISMSRQIRFKISEVGQKKTDSGIITRYGYSSDDLTNTTFLLMNKEGFELIRVNVGKIKAHGWATGEFHIKETLYKDIAKAFLISDQDR